MALLSKISLLFRLAVSNPVFVVRSLIKAFWSASVPRKIVILYVLYRIYKYIKTLLARSKKSKNAAAESLLTMNRGSLSEAEFEKRAARYEKMYEQRDASERVEAYTDVVNHYYDLATDLYTYGWSKSFHFATRFEGETLSESIARHEHFLANKLGLAAGTKVLDVGCGIGGPMVSIARFSGATITGLNNNAYQISRGEEMVVQAGLSEQCDFLKADFMNIPVEDSTYDAVYEIEATCHAPDRVACYSEIRRTLKPGGLFGGFEWTMTDLFDPDNEEHAEIKHEIAVGNGLPDVITTAEVRQALIDAGFEIVEFKDLAPTTAQNPIPWYYDMEGSYSFDRFRLTKVGRTLTHASVKALETLRLAPKGSTKTHEILIRAADGLVRGGQQGLFTPMLFFVARRVD